MCFTLISRPQSLVLFTLFLDYTEEGTRITGWQSCRLCVFRSLSSLPTISAQLLLLIKLTLWGAFCFSQPSVWVRKHILTFAPTQETTCILHIPLGNISFHGNTILFSQVQTPTSSRTDWRRLCRYNPSPEAHGCDLILTYLTRKLPGSSRLAGHVAEPVRSRLRFINLFKQCTSFACNRVRRASCDFLYTRSFSLERRGVHLKTLQNTFPVSPLLKATTAEDLQLM